MTPEDIARIESTLDVTLPDSYKRALLVFPVPAYAGNADIAVWDDPDRLIAYNQELRRGAPGGVKPWPVHFFAIGHAGDGCPQALDLHEGDAVWWVDHGQLDSADTQKEGPFESWAAKYFGELREDMAGDEVDPDGTPEQRLARERKGVHEMAWGCLIVALALAGIVVLIRWLKG